MRRFGLYWALIILLVVFTPVFIVAGIADALWTVFRYTLPEMWMTGSRVIEHDLAPSE